MPEIRQGDASDDGEDSVQKRSGIDLMKPSVSCCVMVYREFAGDFGGAKQSACELTELSHKVLEGISRS